MYLKQIELENFKSFGGKMTIPLMEGYLAVTGPNGSGKSNITDAILFVLGPKSSKAMRAGKLTDLIFDGGKTKNRADYTKVSLVFDNSDHILPWNDDTVRLTRYVKLASNGADYSSYFYINDQKSSMTEFDSLLSRARISADGYNLVQQGDVTRIVQMSSVDRRRILDGISGIASYDADISKSEQERASAQTDLDRIAIIKTELERQLSELEKAMEDARKYLLIQDRLKMAKAQSVYRGIEDENAKIAAHEQNISEVTADIEKMAAERDSLIQKIAECQHKIEELEAEMEAKAGPEYKQYKTDLMNKRVDKAGVEDKQEKLADDNTELSESIEVDKEELAEVEKDIATLKTTISDNNITLDGYKAEKAEVDAEIKRINADLSSKGGEHQKLQDRLNELEPKIDSESEKHSAIMSDIASLDAKRTEVSRQLAEAEEDVNNANFEIKDLEWQLGEIKKDIKENGAEAITQKLLDKQKELTDKDRQENELMDAAQRLGDEYNRLNAEKKAEDRARGSEAVRFVLELRDMRKIRGIHGTIAELGSVSKEYELAMSVAAGNKMQAIVVDDDAVGAEVLAAVKKADAGRVTVLPLTKMMGGKPRGAAVLASQNLEGFAIDLLDFDEKYRNAFWYVMGDTVIAKTMDQARANMGGVRIATMTGELIEASGAMTGGSTKQFQIKFGAASAGKLEEAAAKYHQANDALNALREEMKAVRLQIRDLDNELRQAHGANADVQADIARLESQLKVARDNKKRREQVQAESTDNYNRIVADYKVKTEQQAECEASLDKMKDERAKIRDRITQIAPVELQNAIQQARDKAYELQGKISELVDSNASLNSELSGKTYRKEQLEDQISGDTAKIESNTKKIEDLQEQLVKFDVEIGAIQKIIDEMESGLKDLQRAKDEETERKHKIDLERSECCNRIEAKNGMVDSLKVQIEIAKGRRAQWEEELKAWEGFEIERPLPTADELNRTVRSCETQLEKLGNVNLNAIDDYNAKKVRYDDINDKVATLESRIRDLNKLMERLNAEKKGLFMKTYEGIDVNFRAIYSQLSGGGEAFMNLENEEDPFDGGLLINAKPKNGKLLRLEALSGGEKSLTALAFIFAIQESQPSPFYVLDEVDMFLDAVNAEMVAKRIKESAAKTQFIQVSLRKVTLAQAEHLIGVSRQPDGKSKVIIQPDFAEVSQYENQAKTAEADGNGQ